MKKGFMLYIGFEKHPGDLIQLKKNNHSAYLILDKFTLKINGMIKLTPQFTFKVNVDFPVNQLYQEELFKVLDNLKIKEEILGYELELNR